MSPNGAGRGRRRASPMTRAELPTPEDRGAVLAALGRCPRAVYWLVRRTLDDLDAAAPWADLYSPPQETDLHRMLSGLLNVAGEIPKRIDREVEELRSQAISHDDLQEIEEAEFFLSTTHQMISADQRNLGRTLDKMSAEAALSRAEAETLIELGADLKGKISSALMGAATALITAGRWRVSEVEGVLFPEKAEEARRNRQLLATLNTVIEELDSGMRQLDAKSLLHSWRLRKLADRYALVDLVLLRATLCDLLRPTHRRALYSGDYHQLKEREAQLGRRVREIEDLHLASLERAHRQAGLIDEGPFERLQQLLLETVALLDVEELRRLVGSAVVEDLRATEGLRSRKRGSGESARESRLGALPDLLSNEDLRTFLGVLVAAVGRRASLARETIDQPRPLLEPIEWLEGELVELPAGDEPTIGTSPDQLSKTVAGLLADDNSAWRSFRMVRKMLGKHPLLPTALLAESHKFVLQVMNDVLPVLQARGQDDRAPKASAQLIELHRRICVRQLTPREIRNELGADLDATVELLAELAKE